MINELSVVPFEDKKIERSQVTGPCSLEVIS